MSRLPVWVQYQLERQREAQEKQQRGSRVVRLDPAFGATVPAAIDGWSVVAPCSGCTAPKGCQRAGRCASVHLDQQLLAGKKGPVAWARAKRKHLDAELKGELQERIQACAGGEIEDDAERRMGALIWAHHALLDLSKHKGALKRWFPGYSLWWSAYRGGLFADRTSRYFWVDGSLMWWLSRDPPAPSDCHPRAQVTLAFVERRLDEQPVSTPSAFALWDWLRTFSMSEMRRVAQSIQRVPVGTGGQGGARGRAGDADLPPWEAFRDCQQPSGGDRQAPA